MTPSARTKFAIAVGTLAVLYSVTSMAIGQGRGPALAQAGADGDPYNVVIPTVPSPYWGYTYRPYAGFWQGIADVIHAQGDYMISTQQAFLLREQVRREGFVTRKLQMQQWEWERDFKVGLNNRELERRKREFVRHSRNSATQSEIFGGNPLNELFEELARRPELSADGSVAVAPECLGNINIDVGGRANAGVLKSKELFWPQLLLQPEFREEREAIKSLLRDARAQAGTSQSSSEDQAARLSELRHRVSDCRRRLRQSLNESYDQQWCPRHYMEAKRFLDSVDQAVTALEQPNFATYVESLQGKTVYEVVDYIKKKGVRFAPATNGCEASYYTLYHAFCDELTRLDAHKSAPPSP